MSGWTPALTIYFSTGNETISVRQVVAEKHPLRVLRFGVTRVFRLAERLASEETNLFTLLVHRQFGHWSIILFARS